MEAQFAIQRETVGSTNHFYSPCEKVFRQRRFHQFIKKIFIIVPLTEQNSLVFRNGPLEVVGNVRYVRIQTEWFLDLMIVVVHFNIGENWVQIVVYMSSERNWSFLLLFRFSIRSCLFFVLFLIFFGIVTFIATTFDNFQSQSRARLFKINVIVPIRLKFKLTAVFIEGIS